ncbi:DUF6161 domain-containing protein [Tahibacter harae]|uniref:DUF6161 domain-containing protein n=1 Tax=Tahibacter harae TaxID=2963937 RepID=A0ABT1QQ81_9GAMM|nr:DUF6161 domain-containing protein [Tahibacter harae]MCQ4164459.1 DUF6161 domain-containing protein [Tahibacter harae]
MDDFMFPQAIRADVPDSEHRLEFFRYSELSRWLKKEVDAWSPILENTKDTRRHYSEARRMLAQPLNASEFLERMKLVVEENKKWNNDEPTLNAGIARITKMFRDIENGDQLCLQSPQSSRVLQIARTDPSAAMLFAALNMRGARNDLNPASLGNVFPDVLLDAIICAVPASADVDVENLKALLRSARIEADEQLRITEVRNELLHDQQRAVFDGNIGSLEKLKEEFAAEQLRCKNDLDGFRRHYSNSLALSAPASYWKKKKTRHLRIASLSALGFLILAGVGLYLLLFFGIPELMKLGAGSDHTTIAAAASTATTSDKSAPFAYLKLSAILAPTFIFIWLLRILGRLLGTHLALMEDAEERVTMVTTFLAFSGSEHGDKLVTDADRLLVLTALFRPSAITAADDSPTATVSDVLSKLKP